MYASATGQSMAYCSRKNRQSQVLTYSRHIDYNRGTMASKAYKYRYYSTTASAWDGMYQAILSAKKSIYWEVYIFSDDLSGARFIEALCDRARSGLEVKLILDAVGSMGFSSTAQSKLHLAGAEVLWYNSLLPGWHLKAWLSRLWRRNHRKLLIIDGEKAFLGGVNIDDREKSWQDLNVEIHGEVVRPLLRVFARTYWRAGGKRKNVRKLFNYEPIAILNEWTEKISFIAHSPIYLSHRLFIKRFYRRALKKARHEVNILTPYYSPNRRFLKLMEKTCRRGVRVNLMLPVKNDITFIGYINESFLASTLSTGAKIYLMPGMNHGKALAVDNKFGLVGSFNLTPRSFDLNEESGVYFTIPAMVDDLNSILDGWKKGAKLLDNQTQLTKSLWHHFWQWFTSIFKDYV